MGQVTRGACRRCCPVAVQLLYSGGGRHRVNVDFRFDSGAGIRTLNLAVNSSLHAVQNPGLEFPVPLSIAMCNRSSPALVYECSLGDWTTVRDLTI